MLFPQPFNDKYIQYVGKWQIKCNPFPWYDFPHPCTCNKDAGYDQCFFVPDLQKGFLDADNRKWAYFFGINVSFNRVETLWWEWVSLILLNVYFTNFNSALYEDDSIKISDTENIDKLVNGIHTSLRNDKKLAAKVQNALDSKNEDKGLFIDDFDLKFCLDKINVELPKTEMTREEALKYMELRKEKNKVRTCYNLLSMIVCTISPTISLIGLLMIAIQTPGLINLFYIIFCLLNIYNSKDFVYQKNWNLPIFLKTMLKPFLFAEICVQIVY